MVQNIRSTYTDFILFPSLILLTVSFPLPIAFNSIFTALLFVVFLTDVRNIRNNTISYFKNKRNILLLILFSALLFSVLYSEDKAIAMKGIVTATPLLSLPLAMTTITNLSLRQIDVLKKVFVFSCLLTSFIYFLQTGIRIGLFDGSYKFEPVSTAYRSPYLVYKLTYHQLTPSIHAVFFSLYIAFAAFIVIFGFERKTLLAKIMQGLMILYFFVYLILLTSATINFALYSFIIASIFLKYSFKKLSHYLLFFGIIIIGTAITNYLLIVKYIGPDIGDIVYKFDSPSINQKIILSYVSVILVGAVAIIIKLAIKRNYIPVLIGTFLLIALMGLIYLGKTIDSQNTRDVQINNVTVRINYGAEAIRIIKKDPLMGVGIGDKKYKLINRDPALGDKRYNEFGYEILPDDTFNPHNQFLDFWIIAGILPLLCFFLFLANEFSKAVRSQHIIYTGLVYCFCLFCLTDVPMMVQRGQIFFLFFICLFENEVKRKRNPGENNSDKK